MFLEKSINNEEKYWSNRYKKAQTGWDLKGASAPLKKYTDQLENKQIRILIPGAGNAYEAEYLYNLGFTNVFVLDISKTPLENLKKRVPKFPENHLIHGNFFEHKGSYDLILEQTFFCALNPLKEVRNNYAMQMANLLTANGKLVGVWFDFPLDENMENPPFGGSKEEYLGYLNDFFTPKLFEKCVYSILPREGKELFGIFLKR